MAMISNRSRECLLRSTHELSGLVQRVVRATDGSLALFSREFGELIEFLIQVGLDELEFSFIVAEKLGSCVGVHCVDCGCSSVDQVRFIVVDKTERLVRAVMVDWRGGISNRVTSCD